MTLRCLAAVAVLTLAACGGDDDAETLRDAEETTTTTEATTTTEEPTTTTTQPRTTTTAEKTLREWAQPSLSYLDELQAGFEAVGEAGDAVDFPKVQTSTGAVADAAQRMALSLEEAGEPPAADVVEARALIEALRTVEGAARDVSACRSFEECADEVGRLGAANASLGTAFTGVTEKF